MGILLNAIYRFMQKRDECSTWKKKPQQNNPIGCLIMRSKSRQNSIVNRPT